MTADVDPRMLRRLADMHAVYRMFGHSGELLYIGKTGHLHRFDDHAMKRWFPLVSRITLEWHETEASARVAERRAIETERPRHNIAGNPKVTRTRSAQGKRVLSLHPDSPDRADILGDVLSIFRDDEPGLHWREIAERLAGSMPSRWANLTQAGVSAQVRAFGVRSKDVSVGGVVLKGCRRDDVLTEATRYVVAGSGARSRLN